MYYSRTSFIQTRGYGRDFFVSSGIRINHSDLHVFSSVEDKIPVRIICVLINEVLLDLCEF